VQLETVDKIWEREADESRLWLIGEINNKSVFPVQAALERIGSKDNNHPEEEVVYIYFNSRGGSLTDTMALSGSIVSSPAVIVGVATGIVASAAVFSYVSCNLRYIMPGSFILLHAPRYGTFGVLSQELSSRACWVETFEDALVRLLAERTNKSQKHYRKVLSGEMEAWLDAKTAIEWGIADGYWSDYMQGGRK